MKLEIDIPRENALILKEIMRKSGISSKKNLLNEALTLFEWAVNERSKGLEIASIDREKKEFFNLNMSVLNNIQE